MANQPKPAKAPKILKKFRVTVDGVGYLGIADQVTLPKLTVKTKEVSAGFLAPIDLDIGEMEKLEGSISLLEYNPGLMKLFGGWRKEPIGITLRGAVQAPGKITEEVLVRFQGFFKEVDMGQWKDGEESKMILQYTAHKYQLKINKEEIYFFDLLANSRVVGGVDQISLLRESVGK